MSEHISLSSKLNQLLRPQATYSRRAKSRPHLDVRVIRPALTFVIALALVAVGVTPANAEVKNYQQSPLDSFTMSGTPSNFDLLRVAYGEFVDRPDFHYFFLEVASSVVANQFNDGLGSWAMIMIDVNGDDEEDYRIQTDNETFLAGNLTSPARVWDQNLDKEVKGCSATMYTGLDTGAKWIGFTLPFNCLVLPRTFGIRGYTDFIEDDNLYYDYVPGSTFFKVNHGLAGTKRPTGLDLPTVGPESLYTVQTPGSAPNDLVALSPEVLKSVVTVFCGRGLGTGWAARVEVPSTVIQRGMTTFLVTNHHVVEECLGSGEVTLTDVNGKSAIGFISSFDEKNDLAGIYTSMVLPTLSFRGQRPQQGWWVGVLGSPRGLEGYLTTGIVAKVVQDGSEFGVSAQLNPGNSGGPIFDREGRVLGVATYKLVDSEGLGFARSTPLLCVLVVKCEATNPVWLTGLNSRPGSLPIVSSNPVTTKDAFLPSFKAQSTNLNRNQQNSVNRLLALNDWAKKFICTGLVSPSATKAQKALSRNRARVACDFAIARNPGLSTFFQTRITNSRSDIGRVSITLSN